MNEDYVYSFTRGFIRDSLDVCTYVRVYMCICVNTRRKKVVSWWGKRF